MPLASHLDMEAGKKTRAPGRSRFEEAGSLTNGWCSTWSHVFVGGFGFFSLDEASEDFSSEPAGLLRSTKADHGHLPRAEDWRDAFFFVVRLAGKPHLISPECVHTYWYIE